MNRLHIDRFQLTSALLAILGLMVLFFALVLFMVGGGHFPALDVHAMTHAVLCFTAGPVILVLVIFILFDALNDKIWRLPALVGLSFVGVVLTLSGYVLMFIASGLFC